MDMFTHTYRKLMILKRKEKASKLKTVGRTLFRKKTLLKFAIQINIYTHIYIYGIFTGIREFSRYIYD